MIVLWGIADERPLAAVRAALGSRGRDPLVLDQRDVLEHSIELDVGAEARGRLITPTGPVDLTEVTAWYCRPYDPTAVPAVARHEPGGHAYRHAAAFHQAIRAWLDITTARIINPVAAMASNSSKPYQLGLLRELGWSVPDTLVTTDPEKAEHFVERHRSVIYKSVSDVRSVVARVTAEHRKRFGQLGRCPTQFQAFVAGTDVRVHVVGERLFALEIRSDAVDYRYPGDHDVERKPTELPAEIAERCRATARALALPVAGIDLRRTAEVGWYCFEVNPSPAFPFFDVDGAIATAIAELLDEGGPT